MDEAVYDQVPGVLLRNLLQVTIMGIYKGSFKGLVWFKGLSYRSRDL